MVTTGKSILGIIYLSSSLLKQSATIVSLAGVNSSYVSRMTFSIGTAWLPDNFGGLSGWASLCELDAAAAYCSLMVNFASSGATTNDGLNY